MPNEERMKLMRGIVANAYNMHPNDMAAFRRKVHNDGKQKLGSILLVLTLIGLAIKCYLIWKSLGLTTAPTDPVAGEPSFDVLG